MGEAIPLPAFNYDTVQPAEDLSKAAADIYEPAEPETAATNWQNAKYVFKSMRESLRIVRHNARAIGHLAMLDVEAAQAELEVTRSFQPAEDRQTLMERIRSKAAEADEDERREKWQRKQKRHRLRNKTLGVIGVASFAFSVGASVPLLQDLIQRK
jgi:hypothetical protein